MKKNIGSVLALYPTPAVVVGSMTDGKVNWVLVGHVGIIGHDRVLVSLHKSHHTNKGIRQTGKLSINIVVEELLQRADYVGCVSGAKTDKSGVFAYTLADNAVPVITDSPVSMVCEVVDNYETDTFDNFICHIEETFAEENVLNEKGKISYEALKPILFEMPGYSYLRVGDVIGKCTRLGREYKQTQGHS